MPSSRQNSPADFGFSLSPRERRLFSAALATKGWIDSAALCGIEYGPEKNWPMNARTTITGAMRSVGRKIRFKKADFKFQQRGGGRAGIEYLIS